ncbi:BamA/TamA family outer membrane protein [Candidatus Eisenbacteria bacterium]|uniref:BamA/TamA family outer membrane protein n=1 Tax=Eiseniibacteriota bacterium TaxID=2212470 RepID=A0ABV6YIY9_UNCEI
MKHLVVRYGGAAVALIMTVSAAGAWSADMPDAKLSGPRFSCAAADADHDHCISVSMGARVPWRDRKGTSDCLYPRRDDDEIQFRYRDDDHPQVHFSCDSENWVLRPMRLDEDEEIWSIHIDLPEGRHLYQFVVEEEDDTWEAIDPSNPKAERSKKRGWVSVIEVDEDGDLDRCRGRFNWRLEKEFDLDFDPEECSLLYQRVDGLFIFAAPTYMSRRSFEPSLKSRFGYGFKSKRWSVSGSVLQPLLPKDQLILKISGRSQTDFTDQTGVGTDENTLAAAFFKEDLRDYYRREGASVSLVFTNFDWLRLEGGYHVDDYFSMERKADWSFAKGDFIPNPAIDEGTMRSVFAKARIGTDLNHLDVAYERSGDDIAGGDFCFEQLTAQYRACLHMGPRHYFDFRLKAGTNLSGSLPVQKRYIVGGLGTVRGYGYRSMLVPDPAIERGPEDTAPFGGERMALVNAEYVFSIDGDGDVNAVLLVDSGMAWEDREASMDLDDWKSSAGVGLQFGDDDDGNLRINVIQGLDGGDRDPIVQLRVNRMF